MFLRKTLFAVCMAALVVASATAQTVVFDGVKHAPLGNAKLEVEEGVLHVRNLQESGDGVSILPGEAQAVTTTTGDMDPSILPDGAGVTATVIGQVNGKPDLLISRLSATDLGPDIILWCEWLLATGKAELTADAEISLNGEVVARIPNLKGPIARICDPIRCDIIDPIWPRWPRNPDDIWMMVTVGEPVPAFLPQIEETVMADTFTIKLRNTGARIDNVSRVDYTIEKMEEFQILKQEVAMNNLLHTGLGGVDMNASSGNLILKGFSPEGGDGFSVNLDGATYYYAKTAPLCLDADGASLNFESTGIMDGKEDVFLGSASLYNKDGELFISADYSPIGSDNVQIYLVNNGRMVGKPIVPGGVVARIPNPGRVTGCGKWDPIPPLPCYIIDFEDLLEIQVADGKTYKATGVRVITTEAAGTLTGLNSFSATATGIDQLMILDETTQLQRKNIHFKN